jgi:hypothetical protein
VPEAKDFRVIKIQASLFTPGLQFRAAKVLGQLLSEYNSVFDGDPVSMPVAQGLPREVPQVILTSADGKKVLQAGPARLDVMREDDPISESAMKDFLRWAVELGLNYLSKTQGKAGRLACILLRMAPGRHPAKALSQHFCQQRWLVGPLNRPEHFELHAHKQFRLDGLFEVNSWVRCKTAVLAKPDQPNATTPDAIIVEQDINSLAEQMETRELSVEEMHRFFEIVPQEMSKILGLYFPKNGQTP